MSFVVPVTRFSMYSTLSGVSFFTVGNRYTLYNCSLGMRYGCAIMLLFQKPVIVRMFLCLLHCLPKFEYQAYSHASNILYKWLVLFFFLSLSCQGCVDTEGNCGWCVYDFSCTGQSQDCSIADSFVTVSYILFNNC